MKFKYMGICLVFLTCAQARAQNKYAQYNNPNRGYGTRYREQYSSPRRVRSYRSRSSVPSSDPYTSYKAYGQTWNWYPFYGDSNNAYYYPPRYYEYPFWRYNNDF